MKHQTVDVNMFFEKIKHFIQNEECVCVCVKERERERGGKNKAETSRFGANLVKD